MIVTMKKHLIEQVNGILVMTMLEILEFFVLIIAHHLITMISKITFYKKIFKFKVYNKFFQLDFVYKAYLMDSVLLSLEKYLRKCQQFLADYNAIDKSNFLNIHKYLTVIEINL